MLTGETPPTRTTNIHFMAFAYVRARSPGTTGRRQSSEPRALQAYLGHRNIQHTVRYTELSPTRFKDLWRG
ncbi:hypothetical protein CDS [Bradyrhizobium sp.]|nr:hypothetical protein CDS [Bradyrhizobium sp.]